MLYGMIGVIGVRIWVAEQGQLLQPDQPDRGRRCPGRRHRQLHPGRSARLKFEGIALGTAAALVIFHGMSAVARWRGTEPVDSAEDEGVKPSKLG